MKCHLPVLDNLWVRLKADDLRMKLSSFWSKLISYSTDLVQYILWLYPVDLGPSSYRGVDGPIVPLIVFLCF